VDGSGTAAILPRISPPNDRLSIYLDCEYRERKLIVNYAVSLSFTSVFAARRLSIALCA
jgi:hypothetical protein